MNTVQFSLTAPNRAHYLWHVAKRLVKVKNANLTGRLWVERYLILCLDCCFVDKDGIAFLNFDEGDVLVEGRLNNWISFMMLFHQHL